jgi:hypothetical protein
MNNIYQKTCPQCATNNASDASHCRCGYAFSRSGATGGGDQLDEERLYTDYLAARAKQAAEAAIAAQGAHKADPNHVDKASDAATAVAVAEEARNALAVQQARLNALSGGPAPARVAPSVTPPTSHAVTRTPVAPTQAPRPRVAAPPPVARPSQTMRASAAGSAVPPASTTPARSATPAVRTPSAQPAQPTRAVAGPKTGEPTKQCPNCTARIAASRPACVCGFSFQSARLEALDISTLASEFPSLYAAREAERAAAAARALADAAGRARLAREAERVAVRIEAQKKQTCPHCTAIVAGHATRCACGYVFPTAAAPLMPSLSVDPSDLSQIDDPLKPK